MSFRSLLSKAKLHGPHLLRLNRKCSGHGIGLNWDEEVSDDICQQVLKCIKDVEAMKYLQIPRPFTEREWRDIQFVRLAVLSDALNDGCTV